MHTRRSVGPIVSCGVIILLHRGQSVRLRVTLCTSATNAWFIIIFVAYMQGYCVRLWVHALRNTYVLIMKLEKSHMPLSVLQ